MVSLMLSPQDTVRSSARAYKILGLVAHVRGECAYRIKTIMEPTERVVTERQLEVRAPVSLLTIIR
jgi:hypothetical protein